MVHVFVKHLAEIGAACVRHGSHDFLCLRHIRLVLHFVSRLSLVKYCFPVFSAAYFFSSSTFEGAHRHLRASPFSTCRVRMPAQENFAPCFMRSKIASSPSRLITVRLLRSITNFRAFRPWLALLQVVRSSSTQGSLNLPSTTSLRCEGVSTIEILNIFGSQNEPDSATHLPKPYPRKVLKALEGTKSSEQDVNECQSQN